MAGYLVVTGSVRVWMNCGLERPCGRAVHHSDRKISAGDGLWVGVIVEMSMDERVHELSIDQQLLTCNSVGATGLPRTESCHLVWTR